MDSWHGNDGESFFFFLTLQKVMKSRDELVGRPGVGFCGPLSLSLYREDGEREREREKEKVASLFYMYSLESRVLYFPGAAEVLMGMNA